MHCMGIINANLPSNSFHTLYNLLLVQSVSYGCFNCSQILCILVYHLAECHFIGVTVILMVVEVNSIFLHLRKLMQLAGVAFESVYYRVVTMLNIVSFLVFRFLLCLMLVTYLLIVERHRMSTFYHTMLCIVIFIMWGINLVLFWRLCKNDILRGLRRTRVSSLSKTNNNCGAVKSDTALKPKSS